MKQTLHFLLYFTTFLGSVLPLTAQDDWDTDFIYPEIYFDDKDNNQTTGAQIFNRIVPDKTAYMQPICRDVARMLYFSPSEVVVNTGLRFEIEDRDGVAYKAGSPPVITINLSTRHVENVFNRNQNDLDVELEIYGIMNHEMVHGYQTEPKGAGVYDGQSEFWAVIEGLADAVRIRAGYHQDRSPSNTNRKWLQGYTGTGFFYNWIANNYDDDFLRKLNLSGRTINPWSFDKAAQEIIGKNAQTLWDEYVGVMNQGSKPSPQFAADTRQVSTGQSVTFSNTSSNALTYDWTFDGGFPRNSSEKNPTIRYDEPGLYKVTLVAHNQSAKGPGIKIVDKYIEVVEGTPLVATVTATSDLSFCEGDNVGLTANVTGADGTISYQWTKNEEVISNATGSTYIANSSGIYRVNISDGKKSGKSSGIVVDVIAKPEKPIGTDGKVCSPGDQATLVAETSPANTINWYDDINGSVVATGNEYKPIINETTNFYAAASNNGVAFVGPKDNTFANGGNHGGGYYLIFDAYKPFILKSVKVYAEGSKERTFELRSPSGDVITSKTMMVQDGESRISLDMNIPAGEDYQIGVTSGADLFRNNENIAYPFILNGVVSINKSTASSDPTGFYYYLYDWEISREAPTCISEKTTIEAKLEVCAGVENETELTSINVYPNPTSSTVYIEDKESKIESWKIISVDGQVISTGLNSPDKLDLNYVKKGIYFLEFNNVYRVKMILE